MAAPQKKMGGATVGGGSVGARGILVFLVGRGESLPCPPPCPPTCHTWGVKQRRVVGISPVVQPILLSRRGGP